VSLKWSPVPNAKGYFVSRMGVVCGRTNTLSFTDSTALPGIGYNYGVSAYTKAGGVSPETAAVSTTPQAYPDLVVSDLTWSPAAPKAGDAVLFTATIKNQGVAATPGNVIHGVAFQIDGHNVNWSDISKDSLAPGESRVLSANNGGTGTPTWLAVAGDHTVTAIVDDISRIRESDKANNTLTKNMTVRP
jgi:subtilase family serine protease